MIAGHGQIASILSKKSVGRVGREVVQEEQATFIDVPSGGRGILERQVADDVIRTRRASRSSGASRASRALWALRADGANRAGRTLSALRASWTLRPLRPGGPLGACRPGCTRWPGRSSGASRALWAY